MNADPENEIMDAIPRVLHQVGPKYGVRDFLRQTEAAWTGVEDVMPWMNVTMDCQKKRLRPDAAADVITASLMEGELGPGMIAMERASGRRMGKPTTELTSYIGCGSMLHGMDDETLDVRTDEVLNMKRSVLRIEPDRTVWTMTSAHMAMTRHALERIYQRERVSTGQLIHTIRSATMDMVRNMSIAISANLHLGAMPAMNDGDEEVPRDAATFLIPMGHGLLVTETRNCVSTTAAGSSIKAEFRKHGAVLKATRPLARHTIAIDAGEGRTGLLEVCHVGKTYLSEDVLRPEQVRYRDLFRDACTHLDADAISREMFGGRDAHRKEVEPVPLEMPHLGELRDLLGRCVRHEPPPHRVWGWTATLQRGHLAELARQVAKMDDEVRDASVRESGNDGGS